MNNISITTKINNEFVRNLMFAEIVCSVLTKKEGKNKIQLYTLVKEKGVPIGKNNIARCLNLLVSQGKARKEKKLYFFVK